MCLCLLGNHASVDLRTNVSNVIGATDASPYGLGACEATVDQDTADRLFRRADIKGERVRLDYCLVGESVDMSKLNEGATLSPQDPSSTSSLAKLKEGATLSPQDPSSSSLEYPVLSCEIPATPRRRILCAIHMFSGANRDQDLLHWWVVLAWAIGFEVHVDNFDLSIAEKHDLMNDAFYASILTYCLSGAVAWLFGGPPCSTWAAARFLPGGPPPLRLRDQPAGLAHITSRQRYQVEVADTLLFRFLQLCEAVQSAGHGRTGYGQFGLEHPRDRGVFPFPSIFAWAPVLDFGARTGAVSLHLDQGAYQASSKKPTTILGCMHGLDPTAPQWTNRFVPPHVRLPPLVGKVKGKFRTSAAQCYTSSFSRALAQSFVSGLLSDTEPLHVHVNAPPTSLLARAPFFTPEVRTGESKDRAAGLRQPDLLLGEHLASWPWKTVLQEVVPPEKAEHINLLELRACLLYLRRRAKKGLLPDGRLLLLLDSRVASGAIAHGRSPSRRINRLLRKYLPVCLGSNIYPHVLWIPSKWNCSDAPSRGTPLWAWVKERRAEIEVARTRPPRQ